MAKLGQAQEPSMEEILASIRRIISDDGALTAKETVKETIRSAAPKLAVVGADEPGPAEEPVTEVALEPVAAETIPEPESPAVSELPVVEPVAIAPVRIESPVLAAPAPPPPVAPEPEPVARLLSPQSDEAVQASFSHLASSILIHNARTLEDVVTEMLRPMLKAWLDDNLPVLVERLVREEIERVVRRGR